MTKSLIILGVMILVVGAVWAFTKYAENTLSECMAEYTLQNYPELMIEAALRKAERESAE